MRRQMSGGHSAGSSRALRLDPFALPARFEACDAGADGAVREVELHRQRVVMRRSVRGMRMAFNLPISSYRGVSIRLLPGSGMEPSQVAVVLEHADPLLALPLYVSPDGDEIAAEWRAWGDTLGVPLLMCDAEGQLHETFNHMGAVRLEASCPRRRRRSALRSRRPMMSMRRETGAIDASTPLHRDEREIIARN
ncbi:MAG: hypothetical protein JOZ70_06370 [Pseudolabrys sp.]|nr:hypothetical protein [Pseudolabrys sp.]